MHLKMNDVESVINYMTQIHSVYDQLGAVGDNVRC
jgi:hypothetical protein